jgi:DNA-binding CsgD family transcriptional regulator
LTQTAVADIVLDAVRARPDASLLTLADKAHGNPFLLMELLGGLHEDGRLDVSGGRAAATGSALPCRLAAGMQQRLGGLSDAASQVVQVAAVLPDRFSAGLLAAMLERQPASLMAAVQEAMRADLLVEDDDQLRFRHDLLRQATRQSLPGSLRRAMERQAATIMLELGAAPAEVATQLARTAEVGDQAAIAALRQAAQSVGHSDASAAADLSSRALEILPPEDTERGALVAETIVLLNRATRYEEAQQLAASTLSAEVSQEEEAEVRLRVWAANEAPQRRIEENRRALELAAVSDVIRARHQAWMTFFQVTNGLHGEDRTEINDAVRAAEATGDLESRILCGTTLALLDYADGFATRAIKRMHDVDAMTRSGETTMAHVVAAIHAASFPVFVGALDDAAAEVAKGTAQARREQNAMAIPSWALLGAMVQMARGRLSAARLIIEGVPREEWGASTEVSMNRTLILAEVAARTDDRKLLQQLVIEAHDAYPGGSPLVSQGAAYVIGLAAWHHGDIHEAVRWLSRDSAPVLTPLWANVFDQLILTARVASAAGDAGLRARVLQGVEVLERERPAVPLFTAVAQRTHGLLERDADGLVAAAHAMHPWRPLLYAGAAEDAGAEFARRARNADALVQLNAAFDTYMEHEAVADARRVGRELRRLGVERRIVSPRAKTGWDSLTDAELKVVNLIAQGVTNRSVATQLHLSLHTVKTHVHNAFVKLDINSRAQLTQLMHGSD